LSRGDHRGARNAVAAIQRLNDGVKDHPIIISQMIHVAVEALTAKVRCRMTAEPAGWDELPERLEEMRGGVRTAMQIEGCVMSDFARHAALGSLESAAILGKGAQSWPLPDVLKRHAARQWLRRESAIASSGYAEFIRISLEPAHFNSPDLDEAEINELAKRFVSELSANYSRCWQRTNVTLVLDEQIELIRKARLWLDDDAANVPPELESPSIPGGRWRIMLDRNHRTLALELLDAPAWVTGSHVLGEGFYVLPLDGSRPWQFAPKARSLVSQQ
jgi:hypothetical protein